MTLSEFLPLLKGVHGSGRQYSARCPAHDDKRQSLSVSESGGKIVINCHAGCKAEDVVKSLGLELHDLFANDCSTVQRSEKTQNTAAKPIEYFYRDVETGAALFKKIRYPNKAFCWYHKEGEAWKSGRGGKSPPLYGAYESKRYNVVYLVEGEKDVDSLACRSFHAVSLPDGAGSKWTGTYADYFKGKRVIIIPDNDAPGKKAAEEAARTIAAAADKIYMLDLSELWADIPEHGDITDFITAGGTMAQVLKYLDTLSPYTPENRKDGTAAEDIGFIGFNSLQAQKIRWLWYPYIPRGKITIVAADPGTGKTFFCLDIAARVSKGSPFFGEEDDETHEAAAVMFQTAEDGLEDTIIPRLELMKPNFENIFSINEKEKPLSFTDERVRKALNARRPALMIFDPFQAYLGDSVDMHRANEVRPILSHLGRLAEEYNCAVILIMHNSKMSGNKALYKALGTIDIPAVARSMLTLASDPDDPKKRYIFHVKSSLAPNGQTMLYHIDTHAGGICFDGFTDKRADDIFLKTNQNNGRSAAGTAKDEAADKLLDLLAEDGGTELEQVNTLAALNGVSMRTMYDLRKELGIKSVKVGFSTGKKTYWLHPDTDEKRYKIKLENENIKQTEFPF